MGIDRLYKRGTKIDGRNRVVIPAELLEEFSLKIGDRVCIYANFDERKIIVKKEGSSR